MIRFLSGIKKLAPNTIGAARRLSSDLSESDKLDYWLKIYGSMRHEVGAIGEGQGHLTNVKNVL